MADIRDYLDITTTHAQVIAAYLEKYESSERFNIDIISTTFSKSLPSMKDTLLAHLENAINSTKEYMPLFLSEPLRENFSRADIFQVDQEGRIDIRPEFVAGDMGDFNDGIRYGRYILKQAARAKSKSKKRKTFSGENSLKSRSTFWRKFVYEPYQGSAFGGIINENEQDALAFAGESGSLYEQTIKWRQNKWGKLTPYWIWIDIGNMGLEGAFPQFSGTNFVSAARFTCQRIFDIQKSRLELEYRTTVTTAVERFLLNPEATPSFEILDTVFYEGRQYLVYVTSTKRIGVALEKTYTGLKRKYGK